MRNSIAYSVVLPLLFASPVVLAETGAQAPSAPPLINETFNDGTVRWEFSDAESWEIAEEDGNRVLLNNKSISNYKPTYRSPHNIALLRDVEVDDFVLTFKVKSNKDSGAHRDCCVFFGYQNPDQFYYVHLGAKPDPASGQIMLVDKAARRPLTKNEKGVPWTENWHVVKLERSVSKGYIRIFFDDMLTPLMEVEDKTFGKGRVGIGSFDDMNSFDDVEISLIESEPAKTPTRPEPTVANFRYGEESERQVLDFWQAKSDQPAPLVVLIHGGGWRNGDKANYARRAIAPFLRQGISVAAINYRFIDEAMKQEVTPPVKAPLMDAARAIQTIRSQAADWNIDPDRIAVTGSSAGACTSLWLALHDDLADPSSTDPIAKHSTRVLCAAVSGAQTSLDPIQVREWISNAIYGGHAFGFAAKDRKRPEEFELLLKNREEVLPWIREYSPIELISEDDSPIYLEYPNQDQPPVRGGKEKDPTHSAMYGVEFQKRCQEVGLDCELVYPGLEGSEFKNSRDYLIHALKN